MSKLFKILLAFFFLIPLVEIYLLIKVGGFFGVLPTIFLVVFTAVLGVSLLRIQGFSTIRRVREKISQGALPAIELIEGLVLAVAGALLLTPGFFTDAIGFLCLIPSVRRFFITRFFQRVSFSNFSSQPGRPNPSPHDASSARSSSSPRIIDGESYRED